MRGQNVETQRGEGRISVRLQLDEVLDVLNELASESDSTGTETDEEICRREEKFWSPV